MTRLRQRFVEDMRLRNFSDNTIASYVRAVRQYAGFFGKSPEHLESEQLGASEFIRRFMLHVLPSGFVRIRHFGFLPNRNRKDNIEKCRQLVPSRNDGDEKKSSTPTKPEIEEEPDRTCPKCRNPPSRTQPHLPANLDPGHRPVARLSPRVC